MSNAFIHLTNYSINKKSLAFVQNNDAAADDHGNKWSLSALKRCLARNGVDVRAHSRSRELYMPLPRIKDRRRGPAHPRRPSARPLIHRDPLPQVPARWRRIDYLVLKSLITVEP
jgi:hypothetical protein